MQSSEKQKAPHPNTARLPIPGPGRPKQTPEQKLAGKVERLTLKAHLEDYLKNGQALKDFAREREKAPSSALDRAERRIYGLPTQPVAHTGGLVIEIVSFTTPITQKKASP